jgi:hypothetical protein
MHTICSLLWWAQRKLTVYQNLPKQIHQQLLSHAATGAPVNAAGATPAQAVQQLYSLLCCVVWWFTEACQHQINWVLPAEQASCHPWRHTWQCPQDELVCQRYFRIAAVSLVW